MNRFSNNYESHLEKLKITWVFLLKAVAEYLIAEVHQGSHFYVKAIT